MVLVPEPVNFGGLDLYANNVYLSNTSYLTSITTNPAAGGASFTGSSFNIVSPASFVGGSKSFNLVTTNNTNGFAGSGQINQVQFNFNAGGPSSQGNFTTLYTVMNLNQATANTSQADYVSAIFVSQATVPDTSVSILYGINPNVRLTSTASGWLGIIGEEIDIAVQSGATVQDKFGLTVVQTTIDGVLGSRNNVGISLANQIPTPSTPGWEVGYAFGGYAGYNPMSVSGTLIGTVAHATSQGYGISGSMGTTKYGVDFTGYNFSGAPLVMPIQAIATASSTGKVGSICWDGSGFIYICVATNSWKRVSTASW